MLYVSWQQLTITLLNSCHLLESGHFFLHMAPLNCKQNGFNKNQELKAVLFTQTVYLDDFHVQVLLSAFLCRKHFRMLLNVNSRSHTKMVLWTHPDGSICKWCHAGQKAKWPGPEGREMSDILTCLTVETIIDLQAGFNWLQGLSSSK